MSKEHAMRFPLVGSAMLLSLFLLFKFLSKDLVNAVLTCYFFVLGVAALSYVLSVWIILLCLIYSISSYWTVVFGACALCHLFLCGFTGQHCYLLLSGFCQRSGMMISLYGTSHISAVGTTFLSLLKMPIEPVRRILGLTMLILVIYFPPFQLWSLSSQGLRLFLQFLEPFSVYGMLNKSIG